MEDIHLVLGIGLKELELLLDGFITLPIGACHILLLHVIIILQENINHVELLNQLPNAKIHVLQDIMEHIQLINGLLIVPIQSHQM